MEGVISWQNLLEIGNNASEGNLRARLANIAINQVVIMETRVNYAVSEKEVSCDDIDKDDMGDRVDLLTRLTGVTGQQARLGSHGLYSAVLVV